MPTASHPPPSEQDIIELLQQHAVDIARLRDVLERAGARMPDVELALSWREHSLANSMDWRPLPEDSRTILTVLLQYLHMVRTRTGPTAFAEAIHSSLPSVPISNPEAGYWRIPFRESPMAEGGGLLRLPTDLCVRMGLRAGFDVEISLNQDGDFILRKVQLQDQSPELIRALRTKSDP